MMDRLAALASQRRRFFTYACIGASGVVLDYLLFLGLTQDHRIHYQLANALSTSAGMVNNFVLNARFNFRVQDRLVARFLAFFGVGLIGMVVSSLLLWLFVRQLGFPPGWVKLGTLAVVLLLQYSLNRRTSFRQDFSPRPTA